MSRSNDIEITVLNALYWGLAAPRLRLKVEVENRWVTISGMIERPYQRICAEADARGVPGVAGAANQIRVAPAQTDWPQPNPHHAAPDSELGREPAVQKEKEHGRH